MSKRYLMAEPTSYLEAGMPGEKASGLDKGPRTMPYAALLHSG